DSKIYKSTDDGITFPTPATPPGTMPRDWWSSIKIATSNTQRVYVTGYRLDGTNPKVFLLYTSDDGGATYTAMSMSVIAQTSPNSMVEVVGISPTTDTTVYVKVTYENGSDDSIYRSMNAGQSWTKILTKSSAFGLV